ncbi:hypothetical protein [Mucisphaera calidilacus]|uniref:Uncharacterized protein n=1 Tax=Mucisphaera calidilacus TaxID=2527982 RepID=A0A518C164_9BACT|nr:hypothetical protein [Mucisphaera calidilacus]QDU72965.1 hypothetical protein Pan265_28430 [Mucisphaera calidilacus]
MRWALLWSSLWLLGCWNIVGQSVGWYLNGARVMAVLATVGLLLVWPAARLSQTVRGGHERTTWLVAEAAAITLLIQFALWPLAVLGRWHLTAPLEMTATLLAWATLAALLVGWGRRSGNRASLIVMLILVALLLLTPLLPAGWNDWAPILRIWTLGARA